MIFFYCVILLGLDTNARSQDCMIGLVYSDESEANSMMKVVSRKKSAVGE